MMKNPKSSMKIVWIYGAIAGICVAILSMVSQLLGHEDVHG